MKIKIGPITARYKGTVKIQEADEAARRVGMRAQAKDARGQGTAAATITSTMEETAEGTQGHVVTDMRVTGPAAQFGRGVMQDVSAKLMRQFADCLAEEMSGPAPARGAGRPRADGRRPRRRPPRGDGPAEAAVPSAGERASRRRAAAAPSAPRSRRAPQSRRSAAAHADDVSTSARPAATPCSSAPCPWSAPRSCC